MADNPIKYSDFIQPDGSISDLIEQLEQVQTTYGKMRDDVVAAAKELEAALSGRTVSCVCGGEKDKRIAELEAVLKIILSNTKEQRDCANGTKPHNPDGDGDSLCDDGCCFEVSWDEDIKLMKDALSHGTPTLEKYRNR